MQKNQNKKYSRWQKNDNERTEKNGTEATNTMMSKNYAKSQHNAGDC